MTDIELLRADLRSAQEALVKFDHEHPSRGLSMDEWLRLKDQRAPLVLAIDLTNKRIEKTARELFRERFEDEGNWDFDSGVNYVVAQLGDLVTSHGHVFDVCKSLTIWGRCRSCERKSWDNHKTGGAFFWFKKDGPLHKTRCPKCGYLLDQTSAAYKGSIAYLPAAKRAWEDGRVVLS